jgi:hypothetical protein
MVKTSPKTEQQATDVSKRILVQTALLDYARMARVNDADIEYLYAKIKELEKKQYDDEITMNKSTTYDWEGITSPEVLKERIDALKDTLATKVLTTLGIDKEHSANTVLVAEVLKNIKVSGRKMDPKEANQLATAIFNETLDEPFSKKQNKAERLATVIYGDRENMKQRLRTDLETYRDANRTHPLITKDFIADLQRCVGKKGSAVPMRYMTPKADEKNRKAVRDNFNAKGGPRENFLKALGCMAANAAYQRKHPNLNYSNFDAFTKVMQAQFGEKASAEIDQVLGLKLIGEETPAELKDKRLTAYNAKSKELYTKMMIGILTNKRKFDRENNNTMDAGVYINTIEQQFIGQMRDRGVLDVGVLCFQEPDNTPTDSGDRNAEWQKYRENLDQGRERQIASVHHFLPVGAAFDMAEKLSDQDLPRLEDRVAVASEMANQLGNFGLLLGKAYHDKQEPKGDYLLTAEKNNCVFASEASAEILNLSGIPADLRADMEKYLKPGTKEVKTFMNFSESALMQKKRQKECASEKVEEKKIEKVFAKYFPVKGK